MNNANNRRQFTTYVNQKDCESFIEKCKEEGVTPYSFLKNAILNFIKKKDRIWIIYGEI